jgi:hypothetical protein
MMQVEIRNSDGDVLHSLQQKQVTVESWRTTWPGGYAGLSGAMGATESGASEALRLGQNVRVYDGGRLVYDGLIVAVRSEAPPPRTRGASKFVPQVTHFMSSGYIRLLAGRRLRKRWIDTAATTRLITVGSQADPPFVIRKAEDRLEVLMGSRDISRNETKTQLRYEMPVDVMIRRVTYGYAMRSGEGVECILYNDDQSSNEDITGTSSASVVTGSVNDTLSAGDTDSVSLKIGCTANDLYDQNDYVVISDLTMYAKMDNFASPTYTGGEIIEDMVYILADGELSSDFSQVTDPGRVLSPFETAGDGWESGAGVAGRIAAISDASDNVYGLSVWGRAGAADGLPRVVFDYIDTSDYDYAVNLAQVDKFTDYGPAMMANWVVVGYTDSEGVRRYRSPLNDSNLVDSESVARWGRLDGPVLQAGYSTSTLASNLGKRYLALHSQLDSVVELEVSGRVRTKQGQAVPVSWVRAGDRIKVMGWLGDRVYWIYGTEYDVRRGVLRIDTRPEFGAVA